MASGGLYLALHSECSQKNPPSYIEFHTHIVVGETINGTAILLQDKELDACVCVCVCGRKESVLNERGGGRGASVQPCRIVARCYRAGKPQEPETSSKMVMRQATLYEQQHARPCSLSRLW